MRFSAFAPRSLGEVGSLVKSIALISLVFLCFFVFKSPSFAQTNSYSLPTIPQAKNLTPITNPDVPNNLTTYSQTVLFGLMSAVGCQLAGVDPVNPKQLCLGVDQQTGKIGFVQNNGGAIGLATNLIAGTFLIPVHFSDYVAYTFDNFGFPKKTYAQGIGFTGLQPVLGIFTIFRNLSYILMVFIFLVIGVAIMLRVRIDPRTVMTIQNQIPKLIIGILMITFSYGIAGFLIDMMWVGTYFVVNTLTPSVQQQNVTQSLTQSAPGFANNIFIDKGGLFQLATDGAAATGNLVRQVIRPDTLASNAPTDNVDCGWNVFCAIDNALKGTISGVINMAVSWIVGFIVGVIAFLVFAIAIIVQLFKLWFALLKAFVSVLLDVMLAPFWILGGLIPGAGGNIGIGPWLRDLIANLAVFPAVVFLFIVARIIMDGFSASGSSSSNFNPPLLGNAGGTNAGMFGALIAIGFILGAPSAVEQIKKALKASGPGLGLGGAGTGIAAAGALGGAIKRRAYRRDEQGNTYGIAANAGRSINRRISNSRLGGIGGRIGGGINRVPIIGGIKKTVSNYTNKDLSHASTEEYNLVKSGTSLKQQKEIQEATAAAKAKSDTAAEKAVDRRELGQELKGAVIEGIKDSGIGKP
jgi:hypothetical protein